MIGEGKFGLEIRTKLNISQSSLSKYCERLERKLHAPHIYELIRLAVISRPKRRPLFQDVTKPLSRRELQILGLLGEAKVAATIAKRLRVTPKTVQAFYARMKRKLRAEDFNKLLWLAVLWRDGRLVLLKHDEWRYSVRSASPTGSKGRWSDG
jgi:DNA-binding CsgD family transcriptional regulator